MRTEKKQIGVEYQARLQTGNYFIAVDYHGLKVEHFTELRRRLATVGGEIHVVKNSIFTIAAAEAGFADLGEPLRGQVAVVSGAGELSGAAKILKNFAEEFDRPTVLFGFMEQERLDGTGVGRIADLPSRDGLRAMLAGLIQAPARSLATVIQTPGQQLARVLQSKIDRDS